MRVFYLFFILLLWSGCHQAASDKKNALPDIPEEILDSALVYLESVCGENGTTEVIVMKDGEVLFQGDSIHRKHRVYSVTKSFTSTVLGLLIEDGKCNIDDKVYQYLPVLEESYPEVTFRHFATMTSGYTSLNDEPVGPNGVYDNGPSRTWYLPSPEPLFPPGTEYRYWDSAMNMFAWALTKVAGEPLETYFKRRVADRIGMDPNQWDWGDWGKMDGIVVNGGAGNYSGNMLITAPALLRFGQLFLHRGKWDGKQIIPANWVEEATSPQVASVTGNPANDTPYGYNWWTAQKFPDSPAGTFAAKGARNNLCLVIPAWNMVVVRLGTDRNIKDAEWNHFIRVLGEAFR